MQETDTIAMPQFWPEKLSQLEVGKNLPIPDDELHACRMAMSRIHGKDDNTKLFTSRPVDGEYFVWRIK